MQAGAPACVSVSVLPAMVMVAVRDVVEVFAEQEMSTVWLPVPVDGLSVTQVDGVDAVHGQEAALAVRTTEPCHAAAVADRDELESE